MYCGYYILLFVVFVVLLLCLYGMIIDFNELKYSLFFYYFPSYFLEFY